MPSGIGAPDWLLVEQLLVVVATMMSFGWVAPVFAGRRQIHDIAPTAAKGFAEPLKFRPAREFRKTLSKRVEAYFVQNQLQRRDCPMFYLKAGLLIAWVIASYVVLVFAELAPWQATALAVNLGLAVTFLTFNIVHDAGHGAISRFRFVNQLGLKLMDLVGVSSYVWVQRHNVIHHTYPNIHEYDCDIDQGALARFSPHQPRRWFHRFQHIYLWPLYGLYTVKWQLVDDCKPVVTGRIGLASFRRPRIAELIFLVGGKLTFFCVALLMPLSLHPAGAVLGLFLLTFYVNGLIFICVVQLSHLVELTDTPKLAADEKVLDSDWSVHQARASCDFSQGSRIVSWFLGGLNYQIEHHLFPRVCHVHYPGMAPIVRDTCREFGVPYNTHASVIKGIMSHQAFLRRLAQPDSGDGLADR